MPRIAKRPTTPLADAVFRLRTALQLTQTEFGERIHASLPSVQRYESRQRPRTVVLKYLAALAAETGFNNYRDVFEAAAEKRPLPVRRTQIILPSVPRDDEEAMFLLAAWIVSRHRDGQFKKEYRAALQRLEPIICAIEDTSRMKQIRADRQRAMARQLQAGVPQEEIARKFKLTDLEVGCVSVQLIKGMLRLQREEDERISVLRAS